LTWPLAARADLEGLELILKAGELVIPDLGIVLDADSPNIALALPVQVHLWQRKGACNAAGCPYRPWLDAIVEPQWASGGHGLALLCGLRAYFPLRRRIGPGAPSLSLEVAAVGEGSGVGFAIGGGPSAGASPFEQTLTPRYRYIWSTEPRHEIYLDLWSFGLGAEPF
jgi:hypothetical protein